MSKLATCLSYFFHRKKEFPVGKVLTLDDFEIMGWNTKEFQIYAMKCVRPWGEGFILRTEKIADFVGVNERAQTPVMNDEAFNNEPWFIPTWVREERIAHFGIFRPYYFYAGGIRSKLQYRPPFNVKMILDIPYDFGVLPSGWCYYCDSVTEEFDFFETSKNDIWFAHNFAEGPNWEPATRGISSNHLCFLPKGKHTFDFVLTLDTAKWYLDGKLLKTREGWFDYPYYLLNTLIVTHPLASETEMRIHQFSINQ